MARGRMSAPAARTATRTRTDVRTPRGAECGAGPAGTGPTDARTAAAAAERRSSSDTGEGGRGSWRAPARGPGVGRPGRPGLGRPGVGPGAAAGGSGWFTVLPRVREPAPRRAP